MTFDEKLKQALAENHNERMSRSTAVEKKHRFSLAYKLWEWKMLRDLRSNRFNSRWTLHKARRIVTALTAAAVIVISLTGCVIANLAIGRFSFDDKSDYSQLFIDSLSSNKTQIEEYYGLPEEDGWVIDNYGDLEDRILISYRRSEEIISFEQAIIKDGNMGNVNTENAVVEPMSVYEENDGFFIEMQNDNCGLWWIYNGYLFHVAGNLNKEELINLAYSTKIQNFFR